MCEYRGRIVGWVEIECWEGNGLTMEFDLGWNGVRSFRSLKDLSERANDGERSD
jgi:hypothetical protein